MPAMTLGPSDIVGDAEWVGGVVNQWTIDLDYTAHNLNITLGSCDATQWIVTTDELDLPWYSKYSPPGYEMFQYIHPDSGYGLFGDPQDIQIGVTQNTNVATNTPEIQAGTRSYNIHFVRGNGDTGNDFSKLQINQTPEFVAPTQTIPLEPFGIELRSASGGVTLDIEDEISRHVATIGIIGANVPNGGIVYYPNNLFGPGGSSEIAGWEHWSHENGFFVVVPKNQVDLASRPKYPASAYRASNNGIKIEPQARSIYRCDQDILIFKYK